MTLLMEGQLPRRGDRQISTVAILAAIVLFAVFLSRVADPGYNTAFVDEAIYLSIGQRVLQGNFYDNALQWLFGSYLYPVLVALANNLFDAGLIGARILSALLSTAATLSIFLLTRRLFHDIAALLAMLFFGFAGVSMFVGTLATYDSLGIALLATAAALLAYGLTSNNPRAQRRYYFLAALLFTASVLSKYIALAFLPSLGLLMGLYLLEKRWSQLWRLSLYFILPVGLLFGLYCWMTFEHLAIFFAEFGKHSVETASRPAILELMSDSIRVPLLLGLIGVASGFRCASRWQRVAVLILLAAGLTLPVMHFLTANMRSLDKSLVYALLFIAPLAGVGTYQLWGWFQRHIHGRFSHGLVFALCSLYLLLAFQVWQDQFWGLQRSWPDAGPVLAFLAEVPVSPETHILAEGGPIYDYHLDWGNQTNLLNTWDLHFRYGDAQGEAAMALAVAEQHFDYLIFDGYFTPELNDRLKAIAWQAGYEVVFSQVVRVRNKTAEQEIFLEVYAAQSEAISERREVSQRGKE